MSLYLSTKLNNFAFNLPRGFIPPEVDDAFRIYLSKQPLTFHTDVTEYVNSTIQSVTFPGISADSVTEWMGGRPTEWKSGQDAAMTTDRQLTVSFKNAGGYISYWVMRFSLHHYLSYGPHVSGNMPRVQDLRLRFQDESGLQLLAVRFSGVVWTGISELEMNYSTSTPDFATFSCDFKFSNYGVEFEVDS